MHRQLADDEAKARPLWRRCQKVIAVGLFALFLAGCPRRIDFGKEGRIADLERLLRLISEAEGSVHSLNGEAKVSLSSLGGGGSASALISLARPDRVLLQLLDFFGRPLFTLGAKDGNFWIERIDRGEPARWVSLQEVASLLPRPLVPSELVQLLLGEVPRLPAAGGALELDPEHGAYRVILSRPGVVQRLWIDPDHHRVIRSLIEAPSGEGRPTVEQYEIRFEGFVRNNETTFPRRIAFDDLVQKSHLEVRYTDVSLNEPIEPSLFDPPLPR